MSVLSRLEALEKPEDYIFHYKVEEYVRLEWEKTKKNEPQGSHIGFTDFLMDFVRYTIRKGCIEHGEVEKEWELLNWRYNTQRLKYERGEPFPLTILLILLDLALILEHEGYPIPNLLKGGADDGDFGV